MLQLFTDMLYALLQKNELAIMLPQQIIVQICPVKHEISILKSSKHVERCSNNDTYCAIYCYVPVVGVNHIMTYVHNVCKFKNIHPISSLWK